VHNFILVGALASLAFYGVVVSDRQAQTIERGAPLRPLKGDRLPMGPICMPSGIGSCVRKQAPAADQPEQAREVRIAIMDRSLESI
jgi:hypothetical protein